MPRPLKSPLRFLPIVLALLAGCNHPTPAPPRPGPPPAQPAAATVIWHAQVPEGRYMLLSGSRVAVLDTDHLSVADLAGGAVLWRQDLEIEGHAAADGERLFLGHRDEEGGALRVRALDFGTGSPAWESKPLVTARSAGFPRPGLTGSRLAAGDGSVVAVVRGWVPERVDEAPPARVSDLVVCLDPATGRERWRKAFPVANGRLEPLPAAASSQVVVHDGAALLGLDATSGEERWRQPSPRPELAAAASGTVYTLARVGAAWDLRAFRLPTGTPAWQRALPAAGQERALAAGAPRAGIVVLQHEQPGPRGLPVAAVTALAPQDGRPLWTVTPDPSLAAQVSWPVALSLLPGGDVAVGYQTSNPTSYWAYVLRAPDGQTASKWQAPDPLEELLATPAGALWAVLARESGYGMGEDRLTLLRMPGPLGVGR